ncbi:proline--tRNA ligase [Candidatus Poribacteria bacterium]|nr:proline--tRNA ligase [Candidatus Poribacteria bacterium]
MNIENLVGKRLHDDPKDAQTPGHKTLLRGGYIRQVGTGIFSLLPLAQRVCARIEAIIREEMNAIGGQEILMPVVTPAELWQESGRFDAIDATMVRFRDRNDHTCVLNMTHEEVVVDMARGHVDSYRQFPFMLYQLQTKFRDEPRSRGGLIRVREFTMKDGYSFHRTQEDLAEYYQLAHEAYSRIFRRIGMREFVDVEADSGMMGGAISHEFMLLTPVGEDTLILCEKCGYRANREVARAGRRFEFNEPLQEHREVHTPDQKTIEEVTGFLGTTPIHACKAVAFVGDGKLIVAFVRGDYEVNQTKLKGLLQIRELRPMQEDEFAVFGSVAGFVGPLGVDKSKVKLVYDETVAKSPNLVIGANKSDYHLTGFNFPRDLPGTEYCDITEVAEGEPCVSCGAPLLSRRGIEVGNIFQLGTKYSKAMNFQYHEEDGSLRHPIMGCYGIGVGRAMAAVVEESNDEHGPIWPASIAPFLVQICCLQAKEDELRGKAEELYDALRAAGLDPLLDVRQVGAGFMFADADLIGAPIRVILSRRNLKNGVAELKYRLATPVEGLPAEVPLDKVVERVHELVVRLEAEYSGAAVR